MAAGTYNITDITQGTTYNGDEFEIEIDDEMVDLDSVSIIMEMRNAQGAQVYYKTKGNGISIVGDAADGKFKIDPFVVNLQPGTYPYCITLVFTSGVVDIYVKGTMKVESAFK